MAPTSENGGIPLTFFNHSDFLPLYKYPLTAINEVAAERQSRADVNVR